MMWRGAASLVVVTAFMIRCLTYNVQAAHYERQAEILSMLDEYQVVFLQGTRCRAGMDDVSKVELAGFVTYQFGWRSKVDRHAGVAVAVNKLWLERHKVRIAEVLSTDTDDNSVKGRFGAVRLKSRSVDIRCLLGQAGGSLDVQRQSGLVGS
eukprot:TRINITY_DN14645_c1_g1_i2.p2 TRINITY_DN14645_c1_g1~~TRINITY_DN14645_c1_g1_i2.p2  ORF type:complete len:152 (-),score=18.83 TRINITY_DN14645_c1_g1_i2:1250-1705(-)